MDPAAEMDGGGEPFGMPFRRREVAVTVADELNRHDRGMWSYNVERNIEGRRWMIVRKPGDILSRACGQETANDAHRLRAQPG
jgi:hypothetical protein